MIFQRPHSRVLLRKSIISEVWRFQKTPKDLSLRLITLRMALLTQPLPVTALKYCNPVLHLVIVISK
jgi:hypothetical protein